MMPPLRSLGRAWRPSALLALPAVAHAAKAEILLPLGRNAYQTNEWIDVSVVRGDAQALKAGELVLTLDGADGSKLSYTFPVKAAGKQATEHLHLNGWLLRPGKYTIEVAADGADGTADIEVSRHVRKSSFRLINWGRAPRARTSWSRARTAWASTSSTATTAATTTPTSSAPASISCPTAP